MRATPAAQREWPAPLAKARLAGLRLVRQRHRDATRAADAPPQPRAQCQHRPSARVGCNRRPRLRARLRRQPQRAPLATGEMKMTWRQLQRREAERTPAVALYRQAKAAVLRTTRWQKRGALPARCARRPECLQGGHRRAAALVFAMATAGVTAGAITLRGSTATVTEFFGALCQPRSPAPRSERALHGFLHDRICGQQARARAVLSHGASLTRPTCACAAYCTSAACIRQSRLSASRCTA